ncbi:hypothetical protein CTU88_22395 [Streptomyces sp. JV178]|uniref:hypothetical protein n=1 Tax=Streptomyces sp. JV178 TaxID=858632 RepID=UPI000C1B53CB|nr:hypothetical protein [Streptomyces sp. JV178]PIM70004.1 hypothetical protein CTU88_22395 [Streptomyces sp. JV178]
MIHTLQDISRELERVSQRPPRNEAPPVLSTFDVTTFDSADEYVARLRSTLCAALKLAISESFDGEDLPIQGIPQWFIAASGDSPATPPDFAARGLELYLAQVKGGIGRGWQLQEWLYQFDPDSEFRGWAWWDVTYSVEGHVRIWVDSWGESFFACDELRWLAYTAGGQDVSGPVLPNSDKQNE